MTLIPASRCLKPENSTQTSDVMLCFSFFISMQLCCLYSLLGIKEMTLQEAQVWWLLLLLLSFFSHCKGGYMDEIPEQHFTVGDYLSKWDHIALYCEWYNFWHKDNEAGVRQVVQCPTANLFASFIKSYGVLWVNTGKAHSFVTYLCLQSLVLNHQHFKNTTSGFSDTLTNWTGTHWCCCVNNFVWGMLHML